MGDVDEFVGQDTREPLEMGQAMGNGLTGVFGEWRASHGLEQ